MTKKQINNFIIDDKYHLLKENGESYLSYQLLRLKLYIIKLRGLNNERNKNYQQ